MARARSRSCCRRRADVELHLGEPASTVGVRVPDHPLVRAVAERVGPIAVDQRQPPRRAHRGHRRGGACSRSGPGSPSWSTRARSRAERRRWSTPRRRRGTSCARARSRPPRSSTRACARFCRRGTPRNDAASGTPPRGTVRQHRRTCGRCGRQAADSVASSGVLRTCGRCGRRAADSVASSGGSSNLRPMWSSGSRFGRKFAERGRYVPALPDGPPPRCLG